MERTRTEQLVSKIKATTSSSKPTTKSQQTWTVHHHTLTLNHLGLNKVFQNVFFNLILQVRLFFLFSIFAMKIKLLLLGCLDKSHPV